MTLDSHIRQENLLSDVVQVIITVLARIQLLRDGNQIIVSKQTYSIKI